MKNKMSMIEAAIDGTRPVVVTFESKAGVADISFVDATIVCDGEFYYIDDDINETSVSFGVDPSEISDFEEDNETYKLKYDDCNVFISFPCGSVT